jgi:exosortase/archaeosortase family protein
MSLLLVTAAALLVLQASYRHLEALLASWVFAGGGVRTYTGNDDVVVFLLPDTRAFALQVTPECTSAFLIAPFAVIGAAMLLRRRLDPLRVLLGVTIAAVLLVLANQLRLGVIAGLVTAVGLDQGYQWGHLVIGSLISVVVLAISATIVFLVVASGRRGRHRAVTP